MKKTYIMPSVEVVKISVAQMLASSPTGSNVYGGEAPGGSAGFSRGYDFEEEED